MMSEVLFQVRAMIKEVAEYIQWRQKEGGFSISDKGNREIVSEVDIDSQRLLIRKLSNLFKGAVFLTEEATSDQIEKALQEARIADWTWIVDPIDGTSNYVAGGKNYGIQVALAQKGSLVASWINCPAREMEACASIWEGIVHTTLPSPVPKSKVLNGMNLMIASGDFTSSHKQKALKASNDAKHVRGTVSCAVDYMEFLTGQLDVLVYKRTRPWDHAPGVFLAQASGASAKRFGGKDYQPFDKKEGLVVYKKNTPVSIVRKFEP